MNLLITGGAGFIGSHVAERLLNAGHRVCVADDLSTGSLENIEHLRKNAGFSWFHGSVTNRAFMKGLVNGADAIYHLAAAVGVRLVVESPSRAVETNVRGTEVILELAAQDAKRVLICSTSEVYGKRTTVPFREDDDIILGPPDKGRWSYACSKAIDEFLAIAYWKEKKLPVVVARLFNVVGPRQTGRYGMVLPNLVQQALSGNDMTVYGDGSQRRCFSHVNDVARALIALAESPGSVGEVYNVGANEEISIIELAWKIKEMTGSSSRVVLMPYEQVYKDGFEDMARRVPDLSKIKAAIGYSPSMNIEAIINSVVQYHRQTTKLKPHGEYDRAAREVVNK